ncbi:MAG: glutamyl-tRNA reductase, partial [Actinomycetota bacterium]|nr:glutamyl-tRNA reductase [Actinomycetota bacterium]
GQLTPKTLVALGVSHHRAAVDIRERLYLATDQAIELARPLTDGDGEAVVLSTCNRTEVYLASYDGDTAVANARSSLAAVSGLSDLELEPFLEQLEGEAVVAHLFRVAAGLDSLVEGEPQILGQVRDAYRAARSARLTGRMLNRLFAHALHTGKRVRSETAIGDVASSVALAAAELADRLLGDLANRHVLVIGAGKMSELTTAGLMARGAGTVFVANHRIERAERLVRRFGGRAVHFDTIPSELERADIVISSTRCPRPILTAADVEPVLPRRAGRPLVFIDVAVPRDLDPAIGRLDGCSLYDIDSVGDAHGDTRNGRGAAVVGAERIAAEEAARFAEWQRSLEVVPAIAALRRRAEEIRLAELARREGRLRALSEPERQAVDVITTQIVNKLLHVPTVRLKEAVRDPHARPYAEALRHLFALEEHER